MEKAQRVLAQVQGDLGRKKADLTLLEGQLRASEEAQRKARDDCRVREQGCPSHEFLLLAGWRHRMPTNFYCSVCHLRYKHVIYIVTIPSRRTSKLFSSDVSSPALKMCGGGGDTK